MGARVACVFAYIVKIREVTYTQINVIHVTFCCYIPYIWLFLQWSVFCQFCNYFHITKIKIHKYFLCTFFSLLLKTLQIEKYDWM